MTAERLRDLHRGTALLVLPNAWDAASAGVAWACGWPDGRQLPAQEMVAAVRRILRVVDVPLTVDIEEGCSDNPDEVARLVATLVDAGVAGINIEDGSKAPDLLVAKPVRTACSFPASRRSMKSGVSSTPSRRCR